MCSRRMLTTLFTFVLFTLSNAVMANSNLSTPPEWVTNNIWYKVGVEGENCRELYTLAETEKNHLLAILNRSAELRNGQFTPFLLDEERKLFGYSKSVDGRSAIVVLNAGETDYDVSLKGMRGWKYRDINNQRGYLRSIRGKEMTLKVKGNGAVVLIDNS